MLKVERTLTREKGSDGRFQMLCEEYRSSSNIAVGLHLTGKRKRGRQKTSAFAILVLFGLRSLYLLLAFGGLLLLLGLFLLGRRLSPFARLLGCLGLFLGQRLNLVGHRV